VEKRTSCGRIRVMARKSLTAKQKAFCRHVAAGMTLSDAYRASYSADNMSAASVHTESSLLMSNPAVYLRTESLISAKDRALVACSVSDKDRVLQKLRHLLDHATGVPSEHVALRAADLLGKCCGL